MFNLFWHLFDTNGFPPRWTCGAGWAEEPLLGWLHIVSDIATCAAYYAVPCVVAWYVLRKPEVQARFPKLFWIFLGLVFVSCGTVHLLEAGIFWWPHYRLSAIFKVMTAVVSLLGVLVLAKSLPLALDLKMPEQLQAESEQRRQAELKLDIERKLLHTLTNNLPDSIYFKDVSGKYLRVSRSLDTFFKNPGEVGFDETPSVGKAESSEPINLDQALAMMEGDRSILNAVVRAFLEEGPMLLGQLTAAIDSGDQPLAIRAAHTLKGNFRILRQPNLLDTWDGVESLAKEGRLDEIREPAAHARKITLHLLQQLADFLEAEG